MSIQLCLALLALSALTSASDPGCEVLIKPVEDRNKIYGKWLYHAGTSDSEEQMKIVKCSSSAWMKISPSPGSEDYRVHYGERVDGNCLYGTGNSSTTGNMTKVTFYFNSTSHENFGLYLETCPDCLLWLDEVQIAGEAKKAQSIYFFTKTGHVDPSHLQDFKKQLRCLNLLGEIYFPETTNFCPEVQQPAGTMTEEQ